MLIEIYSFTGSERRLIAVERIAAVTRHEQESPKTGYTVVLADETEIEVPGATEEYDAFKARLASLCPVG